MLQADSVDVLRSLAKWIGEVLPATYDVQPVRTELAERPSAIVQAVGPMPTTGSAYLRQWQRDFEVFIYPTGVEGDPFASLVEAEQLAVALQQVIEYGGSSRARALRMPVYDYSDVPLTAAQTKAPFDWLPLSNISLEPRIDPEDDTLYTVVLDLRVSWSRDGDVTRLGKHLPPAPGDVKDTPVPGDPPLLQDVRSTFHGA